MNKQGMIFVNSRKKHISIVLFVHEQFCHVGFYEEKILSFKSIVFQRQLKNIYKKRKEKNTISVRSSHDLYLVVVLNCIKYAAVG